MPEKDVVNLSRLSDPLRPLGVAQHLTESQNGITILTKGLGLLFGSQHDGSPV